MTNPRPKVWAIKEQVKTTSAGAVPMDYSAAYEYGDLEFITDMDPPLHPGTVRLEWERQVLRFLKVFDPDRDYVILTGSPLAIFLVGQLLGGIEHLRRPRVLVWRREQSRYVVFN